MTFLGPLADGFACYYKISLKSCYLLAVVADSPQRAHLRNVKQFNSYHGCDWCLVQAKQYKMVRSMVYPLQETNLNLRTHDQIKEIASKKESDKNYEPSFGVKGLTCFYNFHFDIVKGFSPDVLHSVYLGVTRLILTSITDSKYNKFKFYVNARNKEKLNKRLTSIRPCSLISRKPRSTELLKDWKGSEFQNFLLYYSAIVLDGLVNDDYLTHFLKLSKAIFLLTREAIDLDSISKAEKLLKAFVFDF